MRRTLRRNVVALAGLLVVGGSLAQAVQNLPARVMLVIEEKSLGSIPTAEVEAVAIRMLRDYGIQVFDQEMVRANLKKDQQLLKMVGDNRGAAALGMQFSADVVIAGEAVAKPSARRIAGSSLRSYQAVVTLRAVRTDSSVTLASSSEVGRVVGIEDVGGSSKALQVAGKSSLEALIPEMLLSWQESQKHMATGGADDMIVLTVGGVDQMWKLRSIREHLNAKTDWVSKVEQRSYTAGAAVFHLASLLKAEALSEKLVLQPPEGLLFQVLQVQPGKVHVRAVAVPK